MKRRRLSAIGSDKEFTIEGLKNRLFRMTVKDLPLNGLKLVSLISHSDERGSFTEIYKDSQMRPELGVNFVQDNFSRSRAQVFRGLHAQASPAQGKLVGVTRGKILDIVLDIRVGSPTFGERLTIELDDERREMIWIPPGFAHGFLVIGSGDADVFYKCDAEYSMSGEVGINWADPYLGLYKILKNPIVSKKDQNLPSWKDYCRKPAFEYASGGKFRVLKPN